MAARTQSRQFSPMANLFPRYTLSDRNGEDQTPDEIRRNRLFDRRQSMLTAREEQNTGDEELVSQAQASLSPIHLVSRLHLLRLLLTDRHVKSAAVRCDGVILWQARRQSRKTVGKAELMWYLMPTANNGYVLQPAAYPYPRTFACPSSGRAKVWGYGHGHDLFCRVTKPAQLV